MDFLDSLNAEQRKAATIVDGYELMLAGAGTGKTHTLITRVAYLIANGVPAYQILLLTFTNKAAQEMRERLVSYVGADGEQVTAMTFHSFAMKMFREYQSMLSLPKYRVLDDGDDDTLMRGIRKTYLDGSTLTKEQIKEFPPVGVLRRVISISKNQQVTVNAAISSMDNQVLQNYREEVLVVLLNYEAEKQRCHYVTFDDMLVKFLELLRSRPVFLESMSERYRYVMCDEYQDTNCLQEKILRLLTKKQGNLCVVGDDNQSIYKFRSADIQNILTFEERYPGCNVVSLVQNYRSTQEILDVSNAMMTHAEEGIPKQLIAQMHGDMPRLVNCADDKEAAAYLVAKVKERQQQGIALSDQSVLVRQARGSAYVEQECVRQKVPFVKYGGKRFVEQHTVRMAISYLRLALNDKDELAWRMVLQEYPGIGGRTISQILDKLVVSGVDVVLHPMKYLISIKAATALSDFENFWDTFCKQTTVAGKIRAAEAHYGNLLVRQYERTTSEKEVERIVKEKQALSGDMEILRDMAGSSRSVQDFLDNLMLDAQAEKEWKDALVISTVHSAKGLEWDVVYVLHPVKEVFSDGNPGDEQETAEERRILYVALTRAKFQMELVQASKMMLNGKVVQSHLSSFLSHRDVFQTLRVCRPFDSVSGPYGGFYG